MPEHWGVLPLKRIGWFSGGAGFPISAQGNAGEEILFAKVSDMNSSGNEREIVNSANTVSQEVARDLGAQVFDRNTIIFPKVGGALLTNKRRILVRKTCIDNNLMGCVVTGADAEFTFRMLGWLDLARMAKPGPVPAISEGEVREVRITLPPLPNKPPSPTSSTTPTAASNATSKPNRSRSPSSRKRNRPSSSRLSPARSMSEPGNPTRPTRIQVWSGWALGS